MYRPSNIVVCAGVAVLASALGACGSGSTPTSTKPSRGFTGTTATGKPLFVATNGNDANSCASPALACRTIGGAVSKAASGDTIHVASGTYNTTSSVSVGKSLTIEGAGAATTTVGGTADAPVSGSVFHVDAGVTVSLTGLTITGGRTGNNASGGGIENLGTIANLNQDVVVGNAGGGGGGISNRHTIATLTDDTITGNTTTFGGGGGISNSSNATIETISNDTISGNHAAHNGGGIQNGPSAGITLVSHDTITGNTPGDGSGGGILNIPGGRMAIAASIVADNPGRNCIGAIVDDGYNLEDTTPFTCGFTTGPPKNDLIGDPKLAPLANNGGTTPTHALLTGSPAIDVVPSPPLSRLCLGADQRGVPYLQPGATGCDIGSFQVAH
jgi:hypothetical protein